MASPVQQLIQTMLSLREIATRERLAQVQEDSAAVDMLGRVSTMVESGLDPQAILKNSAEWADRLNISEEALANYINTRQRSVESIRAELTAEGAVAVPAEEVASATLTGQSQGALAGSALQGALATGAQELLADPNTSPQAFGQFLQYMVNRQTPGQAALDTSLANLDPSVLMQGAQIGIGTQMSAGQEAQNELGWAGLRQGERQLDLEAQKFDFMRVLEERQLAQAKDQMSAEDVKAVDELIAERNQILEFQGQRGITLSPEGLAGSNEAYNLINARLRAILNRGLPPEQQINLVDRPVDSPTRARRTLENPNRR